jgi:hypothetical protein
MRIARTCKTLKLNRETLRLMADSDLRGAAAGAVNTGVTNCPVNGTKICCTLHIACVP